MHKISNDSRVECDVDRILDHANRHKSITKQDVLSTARVLREKRKRKKLRCAFCSLTVFVREQSFSIPCRLSTDGFARVK